MNLQVSVSARPSVHPCDTVNSTCRTVMHSAARPPWAIRSLRPRSIRRPIHCLLISETPRLGNSRIHSWTAVCVCVFVSSCATQWVIVSILYRHYCFMYYTKFIPYDAHCCHMVQRISILNHPVPDRVKPSFVIFDIRALWRSGLSVRVPGCQKLQMAA